MPRPKRKPEAGRPKARWTGPSLPKSAVNYIKAKYRQQFANQRPRTEDPSAYATDKVEEGVERGARFLEAGVRRAHAKTSRADPHEPEPTRGPATPPEGGAPKDPAGPGPGPKTEARTNAGEGTYPGAGRAPGPGSTVVETDTRSPDRAQSLRQEAKWSVIKTRARAPENHASGETPPETAPSRPFPEDRAGSRYDRPLTDWCAPKDRGFQGGVEAPYGPYVSRDGPTPTDGKQRAKARKAASGNAPKTAAAERPSKAGGAGRKTPPAKGGRDSNVTRRPAQALRQQAKRRAARRTAAQTTTRAGKTAKTAAGVAGRVGRAVAHAVASMVGGLIGFLGGGVLLAVLLAVAVAGALVSSPFGILFANQDHSPGTISVTQAAGQIDWAFSRLLDSLQEGGYDDVVIHGDRAEWPDVLAVFAVKTALFDGASAVDVVTLDEKKVERLTAVFWDMDPVRTEVETRQYVDHVEHILHIYIEAKTPEEAADFYRFKKKEREALAELLKERALLEELFRDLAVSDETAQGVLDRLPEELPPERRAAVEKALELVGKVSYFWGGKSSAIGWDSRWGTLTEVTAPGSSTTGSYLPFGLDCTGLLDWAFRNAGLPSDQHWYIGTNLTETTWKDAQPGDIVLNADASHVGLVVGRDSNGRVLAVHCSYNLNTVAVSDAQAFGFTSVGVPSIYGA